MARMNSFKTSVLACTVACLGLGCSSDDSVNVGDGTPVNVDKSKLEAYAGSWDGYVEAYTFPSGTDRVRVVLDDTGNGTLQVGDGSVLPPPTNPDVGYPDALRANPLPGVLNYLWDGLAYPIAGASVESERIRFAVDTEAAPAFDQWCAIQTTTYEAGAVGTPDNTVYRCVDPSTTYVGGSTSDCATQATDTTPSVPVDCGKMQLCNDVCSCSATSCTSGPLGTYDISFDAALSDDGRELVGTIVLSDQNSFSSGTAARTIRLKR